MHLRARCVLFVTCHTCYTCYAARTPSWAAAHDGSGSDRPVDPRLLAQRQVARAVRADTLLSTVQSIQRSHFPTRRAAAARAAPSTPRLLSAARVGPVVYGLLLTFRGFDTADATS